MQTAARNTSEPHEAWNEHDPAIGITVNFPYHAGTGNQASAAVPFAIALRHYLDTRTNNAEQILLPSSVVTAKRPFHSPGSARPFGVTASPSRAVKGPLT